MSSPATTLVTTTISGNLSGTSNTGSNAYPACALNGFNTNSNLPTGGIRTVGSVVLRHTVVAGNTAPGRNACPDFTGGDQYDGTIDASSSYNLIGDGTGVTGITDGTNGNRVGTATMPINPLLGPLANNGGPTLTRLPQFGSPLIDGGDTTCPTGITVDQRGIARPQGAKCDIGIAPTQTANPVPPMRAAGPLNPTPPAAAAPTRARPTTPTAPAGATATPTPLPFPSRRAG